MAIYDSAYPHEIMFAEKRIEAPLTAKERRDLTDLYPEFARQNLTVAPYDPLPWAAFGTSVCYISKPPFIRAFPTSRVGQGWNGGWTALPNQQEVSCNA